MEKQTWNNSATSVFQGDLRKRASTKRMTVIDALKKEKHEKELSALSNGALSDAQLAEIHAILMQHEFDKAKSVRFRILSRDKNGNVLEFEVVQS